MARLTWGDRPPMYDLGIDLGVLYLRGSAVPWNGLVSVEEAATGEVNADHYFDGNRIHITHDVGAYEAQISAFTYPEVFAEYNGYSERDDYKRFGFSYRTQHGFDSYKLHIVYNLMVRDTSRNWVTMSSTVDPSLFDWKVYATSEPIPGARPAARLTLEAGSTPEVLSDIEDILYGTDTTDPRLPLPAEVIDMYESVTTLRIRMYADGSYSAEGPDSMVKLLDNGRFSIEAPSVFLNEDGSFVVSSQ